MFSLYICFHVLHVLFASVCSITDTVSWLAGVQIKVMLQQPLTCGSSSMLPTCFPQLPTPLPYTCLVLFQHGPCSTPCVVPGWPMFHALCCSSMAHVPYPMLVLQLCFHGSPFIIFLHHVPPSQCNNLFHHKLQRLPVWQHLNWGCPYSRFC